MTQGSVDMRRGYKIEMNLLIIPIIFLVISLTKVFLSFTIHSPHIMFDESLYTVITQKIIETGTYFVDGNFPQYPPLYPLILTPILLLTSSVQDFFSISLILNSFISTLIIFPAYFLSREYLDGKESIMVALLVSIAPGNFIYSFTLMSENLYLPLFLISVYFMTKVLKENTTKNNLFCGIFISLTIITKLIALPLFAVYVVEKVLQWRGKTELVS